VTATKAADASYNSNSSAPTTVTFSAPSTSYTAPSPSGGGNITAGFTTNGGGGCSFTTSQFGAPQVAPAGVTLSHGVFSFTTNNCGTGSTLNFTITYPGTLPANTRYYKYGPEFGGDQTPHWYELPGAQVINGNQITFSITDNGQGDSNLSNGFITDPGGPGVPSVNAASIPTLSEWGMILMAGLMGLAGLVQARRRLPVDKL
jgi:hypothetical protein